ncbi:MAG TPA: PilZ domain-containing protein [Phycisphaerae bacterium]|nr:PilZ domain-containing protein [Phycisphaerae bacterium]
MKTRAPVILESPVFDGATINGFLVAGDAHALLMEVTGRPAVKLNELLDIRCDGQLYGERRFSFSTRLTATPTWGQTTALAFERPAKLVVMERRRFLRAKLAPSSKVALRWEKNRVVHRHEASLLNISADGLACRVQDAVAANIERNALVQISLDVRGLEVADVSAIVTNKMPGSEGCHLLGLQFVRAEGDVPKIAALRSLLSKQREPEWEKAPL